MVQEDYRLSDCMFYTGSHGYKKINVSVVVMWLWCGCDGGDGDGDGDDWWLRSWWY